MKHAFRASYVVWQQEMADAEDAGTAAGAAAAAAAEAAAAEPATDQWVQCDRCRTWRIVPDQHWPAVEADPRDVCSPVLCHSQKSDCNDELRVFTLFGGYRAGVFEKQIVLVSF